MANLDFWPMFGGGRALPQRQEREAVRIRRPAPGEAGAICRCWRGTARCELLLPGWAAEAVVRPEHCPGGSIDAGLSFAAASVVLIMSQCAVAARPVKP